jgi:hypothetical protein
MAFLTAKFSTSGNLNTLVAGSRVSGTGVPMGRVKNGSLSAVVDVDCETNTLTMAGIWQGSNTSDFASPIDLAYDTNNPAATVIATGTAGADANVKKAYPCPAAGYGFKYVRFQILTGVATGNTVDTYAISYTYRAN